MSEVKAQNSISMTSVKAIKDATDEANRLVNNLEEDVTALDTRIDTAEGKVTTLEGNVSGLTTRVTTAEGKITTAENNITSIGNRVTTAEGKITGIEGDITALDGRVDTAEGDITTIEGNITTINGNVTSLTNRVTTAEGDITTLEGQVSTAESNITSLQGRITTAESDITTAEGDISALQTRVSDAEEDVDATLRELSVAQDVVGTINWITNHGTMTSQAGQTFDSNQVYFVVDPNGDYLVGGTRYAVVPEPVASDINNYYTLSISESVQNYVATRIVVDSEGLWIIPDSGGNKVLIATGSGSTYTTAGTYIVGSGNTALASFTARGARIGRDNTGNIFVENDRITFNAIDGTEALRIQFEGAGSPTEHRYGIRATNLYNNSFLTIIPAYDANVGGFTNELSMYVDMNDISLDAGDFFTRITKDYIGIGTNQSRLFISDLMVALLNNSAIVLSSDWSGNVVAGGDITDGSGNVLSDKADTSSLSAVATSGSYNDLSDKPTIPTVPTNVSAFTNDAGYITGGTSVPTADTLAEFDSTAHMNSTDMTSAEITAFVNNLNL